MSKKSILAKVVSVIDEKTAKVCVSRSVRHPLYQKVLKIKKNFMCHNEKNLSLQIGDDVSIVESRPFSKTKNHIIISKISV